MNYFTVERNETGQHLFVLKNGDRIKSGDIFARKNLDGSIELLENVFVDPLKDITTDGMDKYLLDISSWKQYISEIIDNISESDQYEFETFINRELKKVEL